MMLTPTILGGNCALKFQNAWLTRDGTALLGLCDTAFTELPLDGKPARPIATFTGDVFVSELGDASFVYLDKQHLVQVPLAGGASTTLSLEARPTPPPKLTPDGSRVVYVADSAMGQGRLLLSVPAGGGTATTLYAQPISFFKLSPDGSRVFTRSPGFTVLSIPVAGGVPVDLGNFNNDGVFFSPDGRKIAFVTHQPGTSTGPYTLGIGAPDAPPSAFGGTLDTGGGGANQVVFLPDGSRAIVDWTGAQQPMLRRHIDSVPVAGGEAATLMTADKGQFVGIVGKKTDAVLFASQMGALSPELSIVDASGGAPVKLSTLDKCFLSITRDFVAVSPDRTRAVYTDALGDLVLADLDGRTVSKLVPAAMGTKQPCSGFLPIWSPDGSLIAYQHCATGIDCELRVVTPSGTTLTTGVGAPTGGHVYFSPDSKRLLVGGAVLLFGANGVTSRPFRADVPLSNGGTTPDARQFVPATFPWIDAKRFVVQIGSIYPVKTGIIDTGN